ncbi:MAG: ABC transporter ATP-binding protein, partial [Lachnoclostridium sp.]|nr:ABC transporter ATP-binding protein [Lachnoclostridium sp.]
MDKKISKLKIYRNNFYAVKTIWGISKKRVLLVALFEVTAYIEWLFFSIFFMRYVIEAIDTQKAFEEIITFLGICFIVFLFFTLFRCYMEAMLIPFTDNLVYRKLYSKLYAKARNVELRCFEDADFYNRYTMALENSAEKMTGALKCFFSVTFGVIAAAAAFYSVFLIDNYAILFVISPMIGRFIFGAKMNE